MSVELAPHRFAPAGVRYREMQTVGIDVVPVFRGHEVTERVSLGMRGYFGIAGGARREIHQHQVVEPRVGTREDGGLLRELLVEIVPTVAFLAAHRYFVFDGRAGDESGFALVNHGVFVGDDAGFYLRSVETVFVVVRREQVGSGYRYRAEFMQSQYRKPELVFAFHHEHDGIAFFDAEASEEIGGAVGHLRHIRKGEYLLGLIVVEPYHSRLVRVLLGERVHYVVGEVIGLRRVEIEAYKPSLIVRLRGDELAVNGVFVARFDGVQSGRSFVHLREGERILDDHREEFAVAVVSYHSVRKIGVIIDTVAFRKHGGIVIDGNFEFALENEVEFLVVMGGYV